MFPAKIDHELLLSDIGIVRIIQVLSKHAEIFLSNKGYCSLDHVKRLIILTSFLLLWITLASAFFISHMIQVLNIALGILGGYSRSPYQFFCYADNVLFFLQHIPSAFIKSYSF